MDSRLIYFIITFTVILFWFSAQFVNGIEATKPHVEPPLKQVKMNIPINQIVCPDNLQLLMKKSNGIPVCLKLATVAVLIERGWAVHVLPDYDSKGHKNSEIFDKGTFQITTSSENYFEDTIGFLARPSQQGSFPGVVMIHEWWGLNENIKNMARDLASHGYVVLAVDLYGGQVATTSDGARQLLLSFNEQKGISNINSAIKLLKTKYNVEKIATIGWCFGGSQSLNYATSGNKLDGTIIYYGQPITNTTMLSKINWPVLGFYGDKDQNFPVQSIKDFQSSLNSLGIKNEIHIYSGLGHAFANPSGATYAPTETKDAWNKTISFLENNLKQ